MTARSPEEYNQQESYDTERKIAMEYLNRPLTVRGMELATRLVMPPMATGGCDEAGRVTQNLRAYYDDKTRGGYLGLVITEHSFVSPEGMAGPRPGPSRPGLCRWGPLRPRFQRTGPAGC